MEKVIWNKRYNIGNNIIDEQHQYLVSLINLIIENKTKLSKEEIKDIFNNLIHYANIHFHDEEEIVSQSDYPDKIEHKKLHREFLDKLEVIELDIALDSEKVVDEILFFLSDWLINHILISDKDFAPFLYKEDFL